MQYGFTIVGTLLTGVAGALYMIEIGRLMGLADKPNEKQLREIAEPWRPYRGAAAVLAWHSYNSAVL